MTHDEKVAHHEAAHAVVAILGGAGLSDAGINLNAPSSVEGAFGNAGANTYDHDVTLPPDVQQWRLIYNLMTLCAGAASDAKISGIPVRDALARQKGDESHAYQQLRSTPLIDQDSEGAAKEREGVLGIALDKLSAKLADPQVWAMVEAVAKAAIDAGGILSKAEIEAIYSEMKPAE